MVIVGALGLMALATLMLAGWGWAFRRAFPTEAGWPETVVLGLGTVIFIGGILNLARLAHPWAIAMVAAAGIVLGVLGIRERRPQRPDLLTSLLILAVAIFTIVTQLPPDVYNFHDDLQKYFAYCVRMLETGTVFGSPLSSIGVQTLGAKAFLDGFIASWLPVTYLNGVDALSDWCWPWRWPASSDVRRCCARWRCSRSIRNTSTFRPCTSVRRCSWRSPGSGRRTTPKTPALFSLSHCSTLR
jgi:hypothetical protein